jgi:hypothetical protein
MTTSPSRIYLSRNGEQEALSDGRLGLFPC